MEGVARRFGGRWALRGVSMRVRQGEVLAIRGSNGSGKSTLLRIVASALRPTRGTCSVFGHDVVKDARGVRPLVGLLGHASALYQDLTVAENLRFAARMTGLPDDERAIAAAIDAVGLGAAAQERARNLSSGMQRRVGLARLNMRAPKLLLLDEPYNSFDADGVELVNRLVRATRDAGGATLLITHDLDRVGRHADRAVTMEAGLLLAVESGGAAPPVSALPRSSARVAIEGSR
ncbi:MAG: heme ABC exporter ATP-binding protein CcmA [Gemmatimonadota bacterium]|nr:heme ABC exporter ATP-binding protein CcmA [Gemmatimonadota bacterium]